MDSTRTIASGDRQRTRLSAPALATLRLGVAILWIENAAWKVPPDFGANTDSGLYFWAGLAVEYPVFAPYSWFVETIVLPNIAFVGWIVLLTEASLGAFLLIGLATRFWALVGIAQTLAITLSVLNAPHEWHWSYLLMFLVHITLFGTAAGRSLGLDGVLRPRWKASPGGFAALMTKVS